MSLVTPTAFCGITYDYVIAGGGTAGLTLAARLTENPKVSVAVIEAGEDLTDDLLVNAWGLTGGMLGNPKYDWDFQTVPQESDNNRVLAWPRGRQLGGSSAINLWFWNRASETDINDWGELGNEGWTWKNLFPYFKKSESFTPPSERVANDLNTSYLDPSVHGTTGPIKVSFPPEYGNYTTAWPRTFQTLGLAVNGDHYGGSALGGFNSLISQDPQMVSRSYAANAYYKPNAGRPNLKVLTNALATKVIFDGYKEEAPLVATGVNFTTKGQSCIVKAKREVILSAGVVQSPQLLELSGIGSAALLNSFGIKVLADNPHVGENLQDHAMTSLGFETFDNVLQLPQPEAIQAAITEYLANRTGILTQAIVSTGYLSYTQLLQSSQTSSTLPADAKSYQPSAAQLKNNPGLLKQYELITRKVRNAQEATTQELVVPGGYNYKNAYNSTLLFSSSPGSNYFTFLGVNLHPYSRGSVHISSSDPTKSPTIDPGYLSNPIDLDILSTIALHLQTIASTQPFASLLKGNGTVFQPGYERLTKDNVRQHVKNSLTTIYHPIGTCSMQPRDKGGVVDARLKVYGTKNVRVVDGSVAPLLTRGTIQSFVYAIAEKAADMIKEDWKQQ